MTLARYGALKEGGRIHGLSLWGLQCASDGFSAGSRPRLTTCGRRGDLLTKLTLNQKAPVSLSQEPNHPMLLDRFPITSVMGSDFAF